MPSLLEQWQAAKAKSSCGQSHPLLTTFVERTSIFTLDPWQRHMCARLQRLAGQRAQRILIHAPPQHGKSVILSQRFPAWYLGIHPQARVKLACYNITHAVGFSKIVRELTQSHEFRQMFPGEHLQIPAMTSAESWSNFGRLALRDAQPSFKALGLSTGFVGQGAELLLIDDPYASPQDAFSEAVNISVQLFWEQGAKVRVAEDANVVVMFHRYQEADIAGYLIETEGLVADGGRWELLRYPAVGDGYDKWPDAMGRSVGQPLSPRYSANYYEEMQRGRGWLGQFQGIPSAPEGAFFKVGQIEIVDAAPANLRMCRAWDIGATEDGDYSVGVLMGTDDNGLFYVLDVVRGQWSTDQRNNTIRQTAQLDGRKVFIHGPQDPGAAGKDAGIYFTRLLSGFSVKTEPVSGSKEVRADPFSAQVNAGNVKVLAAPWNRAFIEELRTFPVGKNDDQVDAASDAFTELNSRRTIKLLKWNT